MSSLMYETATKGRRSYRKRDGSVLGVRSEAFLHVVQTLLLHAIVFHHLDGLVHGAKEPTKRAPLVARQRDAWEQSLCQYQLRIYPVGSVESSASPPTSPFLPGLDVPLSS